MILHFSIYGSILVLAGSILIKKRNTLVGKILFFFGLFLIAIYVIGETNFVKEFITGFNQGLDAN